MCCNILGSGRFRTGALPESAELSRETTRSILVDMVDTGMAATSAMAQAFTSMPSFDNFAPLLTKGLGLSSGRCAEDRFWEAPNREY